MSRGGDAAQRSCCMRAAAEQSLVTIAVGQTPQCSALHNAPRAHAPTTRVGHAWRTLHATCVCHASTGQPCATEAPPALEPLYRKPGGHVPLSAVQGPSPIASASPTFQVFSTTPMSESTSGATRCRAWHCWRLQRWPAGVRGPRPMAGRLRRGPALRNTCWQFIHPCTHAPIYRPPFKPSPRGAVPKRAVRACSLVLAPAPCRPGARRRRTGRLLLLRRHHAPPLCADPHLARQPLFGAWAMEGSELGCSELGVADPGHVCDRAEGVGDRCSAAASAGAQRGGKLRILLRGASQGHASPPCRRSSTTSALWPRLWALPSPPSWCGSLISCRRHRPQWCALVQGRSSHSRRTRGRHWCSRLGGKLRRGPQPPPVRISMPRQDGALSSAGPQSAATADAAPSPSVLRRFWSTGTCQPPWPGSQPCCWWPRSFRRRPGWQALWAAAPSRVGAHVVAVCFRSVLGTRVLPGCCFTCSLPALLCPSCLQPCRAWLLVLQRCCTGASWPAPSWLRSCCCT